LNTAAKTLSEWKRFRFALSLYEYVALLATLGFV
jgi:hypothetical protein